MKKVFTIGLLGMFVSVLSFAQHSESTGKIASVTVYPSSARIERTAQFNLSGGSHHISITQMPNSLQRDSIRVNVRGPDPSLINGKTLCVEIGLGITTAGNYPMTVE